MVRDQGCGSVFHRDGASLSGGADGGLTEQRDGKVETMELQGKRVLVVGSGISGIGAVEALCHAGALPVVFDENDKLSLEEVRKKLKPGAEAEILIGVLPEETADSIDLVVLSPGVPTDMAFVQKLRQKGIKIWGGIELAYELGE